jgi:hypothetical protein
MGNTFIFPNSVSFLIILFLISHVKLDAQQRLFVGCEKFLLLPLHFLTAFDIVLYYLLLLLYYPPTFLPPPNSQLASQPIISITVDAVN